MGISVNGPSGIDTASLISQLTELEMQKVYNIQTKQKDIKSKVDAYSQLETYLNDVKKSASSVDNVEDFNLFNTSSTDEDIVTVSTKFGADEGNFDVSIYQLAQREKMISTDNLITDRTATLSSLGINTGTFSINGVDISLGADDTIDNLREKINSATDASGLSLGVTATVLKTADDNFRFVLSSDKSGSDGADYLDLNGDTVLQDLGIIGSAGSRETFESINDIQTEFAALITGESVSIVGTDADGKDITSTFIKSDDNNSADFLDFVDKAFGNNVSSSFVGGKLVVEDSPGGVSSFTMASITVNGNSSNFTNTIDGVDNKTLVNEVHTSNTDISTGFAALAAGEKVTVAGVDTNGVDVAATFVKSTTTTNDDFLKFMESAFNGTVTASFNGDGTLAIEDKNGGASLLEVGTINFGSTDYTSSRTTVGDSGSSFLTVGKDAYFSVDGINLSSSNNEASGVVTGVDFQLKKVSYDSNTLSIDRDYAGVAKKVDDLVNSYNAIARYVATTTKYGNAEDGETVGKLAGDTTIKNISSQVRNMFYEKLDITGTQNISSLAQIGIGTNTDSGQLEVDKEKFTEALKTNYDQIINLFVEKGKSSNADILFGSKNDDTEEGVYDITEAGDGTYTLSGDGGTTNYTAIRIGDIIHFDDGPAKGMYLTTPVGSGNSTITYSKGLSGRLDDLINKLTDSESGSVSLHKQSLNTQISTLDDRADYYQRSVTAYHDRLVKQFAAMEQRIQGLQAQQTAMANFSSGYSN